MSGNVPRPKRFTIDDHIKFREEHWFNDHKHLQGEDFERALNAFTDKMRELKNYDNNG